MNSENDEFSMPLRDSSVKKRPHSGVSVGSGVLAISGSD